MQPSDNRLVLYEPVSQLQDMAAIVVAVNLTMNYAKRAIQSGKIVQRGQVPSLHLYHERQKNEVYETKPDDLIIPRSLEAMVKKYVSDCCGEIDRWLYFYDRFFQPSSFDVELVAVMREFLSNIVWKSNGKIDQLHSAINLVSDARLRETVKFQVMCEFCMEEKIRQAWNEMRNRSFVETLVFWRDPLLVYWCCVMTGDFSKIVGIHPTYSVEKHVLLNLHGRSAHFHVIEYFFSRLDVNDRIVVGARLMRNWCGWTRFLISKYTEDEQYQLFSTSDYVAGILGAFTWDVSYKNLADVLKTWNHIKNLVSGDQFVEILKEMGFWSSSIRDEQHEFLVEFWRATPINLKEYVFQLDEDEFMPQFSGNHDYEEDEDDDELVQRDDRILIAVLSDADLEYRKQFWRRKWVKIVYQSQPFRLKEILNLCLSNDEMATFKKYAMSSPIIRQYLVKVIINGEFLVLDEFLKMFIDGGQREINDAGRGLFKEMTVRDMCLAFSECGKIEESVSALIAFVRVIFGDDVKGEAKFKKQIILRCVEWCTKNNLQNCASNIIYVSDRIFEAALLKKVKNEILKMYRSLSTKDGYRVLNLIDLDEILLWCLGDQQEVEEFKTSCDDFVEQRRERAKRRKRC